MAITSTDVIDGFGYYGIFSAYMTFAFAILLFVIFVIISIFYFEKQKIYTQPINATIVDSNCVMSTKNGNNITYTCGLTVNYVVNNKNYTQTLNINDTKIQYSKNMSIKLYYDPKNPNKISNKQDTNLKGYIFIGVGAFLLIFSGLNLYFVKKYKAVAEIEGGLRALGGVASLARI